MHVTDVVVVGDQDTDPRRLLLKPVLRLTAAGLSPRAVAETMLLDQKVVTMVLSEAATLGLVGHDGRLVEEALAKLTQSTIPVAQGLSVFHWQDRTPLGACEVARTVFEHP